MGGEKLPEDFRHGGDREFLKSPWMQSKSLGDPLFFFSISFYSSKYLAEN